jgi:hypothetical protein
MESEPPAPSPRERIEKVAQQLRQRALERKQRDEAERSEQVLTSDGIVHGPTRAEIVLAALRSLAWAPFTFIVLLGAIELVVGERWVSKHAVGLPVDWHLGLLGTSVVGPFLISLFWNVPPRLLRTVRVRVFEKKALEPYFLLVAIGVYAAFAVAALRLR